ncbi:hypothetical protein BU14_0033s0012 [Porphyra umbilicalis]|uniref:Cytochrome c oxidase copper chaperone n=1 Tax=Porphyra umbilicalis TaxID=2786 RepID=A0A1X6PIZ2_PORUM|nr:hypothetical protein BU14_0033s0012 [Porphyra umbilicalis]|eukprot:OSX80668.1 hypothetical protein BU14_0033s0012 [Porphyra umbilicalis]
MTQCACVSIGTNGDVPIIVEHKRCTFRFFLVLQLNPDCPSAGKCASPAPRSATHACAGTLGRWHTVPPAAPRYRTVAPSSRRAPPASAADRPNAGASTTPRAYRHPLLAPLNDGAPPPPSTVPCASAAAAALPAVEAPQTKIKACCACPDTKRARDECVVTRGEDACAAAIAVHKACMRAEGRAPPPSGAAATRRRHPPPPPAAVTAWRAPPPHKRGEHGHEPPHLRLGIARVDDHAEALPPPGHRRRPNGADVKPRRAHAGGGGHDRPPPPPPPHAHAKHAAVPPRDGHARRVGGGPKGARHPPQRGDAPRINERVRGEDGGGADRRRRRRVDERPRVIDEVGAEGGGATQDDRPGPAVRLAIRDDGGGEEGVPDEARGGERPARVDHPDRVRLVDNEAEGDRRVGGGERGEGGEHRPQRRRVAVHRVDGLDGDEEGAARA